MELSVRPRGAAAELSVPSLRVVEASRLVLHEEADEGRVRRLHDALRRDGMLRNPPVAVPAAGGRAVVLDGANRVSALRALGVPHAVVQMVSHDDPGVRLSVWCHYVPEETAGAIRRAAAGLAGVRCRTVAGEADAAARIAAGGLAAVIDAEGALVAEAAAAQAPSALRALTALYRDGRPVHRIEAAGAEELRGTYGPGALVIFRRFDKSDILTLALSGDRLPAGITRHVIPGRALRVNTPLAWLAESLELAVKQAALDAQLQQRWQAHGVRYYAESTFLFDE